MSKKSSRGGSLGSLILSVLVVAGFLAAVPVDAVPGVPPEVTAVLSTDDTIDPGETRTFDVAAAGVDAPATVTFSGEGVVGTIMKYRVSRLRLTVTADEGATGGLRNLTVTNPDGLADTLLEALLVTGSVPAAVGEVSGRVFADLDGDGLENGLDAGLAAASVFVTDSGGTEWPGATDANGDFVIVQVPVGVMTLVVPGVTGHVLTTANETQEVSVFEGERAVADPVGYQPVVPPSGAVAGRVFEDLDGDGLEDASESGMAGVAITVTDSAGEEWVALTDAEGDYVILEVAVGLASVAALAPLLHDLTTANGVQVVTVVEGTAVAAEPVGYQPVPAGALAGRVFEDIDGNGIEDVTELGLAGVAVNVTDSGGAVWPAITDSQGDFVVETLAAGQATQAVVEPFGFGLTTGNDLQEVTVLAGGTAMSAPVGYEAASLVLPGVYAEVDVHLLLDARDLTFGDGDAVALWVDAIAGYAFAPPESLDAPAYVASAGFGGEPSVQFDGVDDVLQATFGTLNTEDFVFHLVVETQTYAHRRVLMTRHPSGGIVTKNVLAYDDYDEDRTLRGEPSWATMSGPDGTQAQHYHPILSTTVGDARASPTDETAGDANRVVLTYVVRESGQVRFWDRLDDILDKTMSAPGNDLDVGLRFGAREDNNPDSFANFRLAYVIVVNESSYTEEDLLAAATDLGMWFNVPGFDQPES